MRALETYELHGRPTCSECSDRLKRERGCKKPGEHHALRGSPTTWTSPMLQGEGERIMYECPVGYLLREAPHVYDVVQVASHSEALSPIDFHRMPRFMQQAMSCVSSERQRLREVKEKQRSIRNDAAVGARIRAGQ